MHKTVIAYATRHQFRLGLDRNGYYLRGLGGEVIDRPFFDGRTARGALRMMRRHLRRGSTGGRAGGE